MKIIEDTMCYTSLTRLLVFLMVLRMQTHISCFLIAPDKSSKDMSNVGSTFPHSSHSYSNFRRSKQILTYIYKSYLVFHDFTIFVTHGVLQWLLLQMEKLMKKQQMTNVFQSTKGFNASTREK